MTRRTWIAALVCVAALLAHSQDLPPADRLLFADGLYSRGLYEMAAKEYRSFIETAAPDEPLLMSARFRLGECLRQTGDVRGADREYAAVFNGPPDGEFRFRAGYRRAELFAGVGHDAAALDLYKAVLDAGAKGAIASAAAYQRGILLLKAGAVADGVGALRHAADLAPESETAVYALLKLGELHADAKAEAKGDGVALAIGFYDRAAGLTSAPPRAAAEALFQSGDLSFRRSDHSRAAETMSKLLKRYPDDARAGDARFRLAWAEYHRGRFGAALAAAAAGAEEEGERRADWLYLRANCQRQLAKADEAVATYRELLAKHAGGGREGLVRYEMALVEYRRGRYREALDALAPAKVPPEQEKEALWIKADSHAGIGETDSAVECYRALVREFPDSDMAPHAMYRLAHYFQSKSRHAEAAGQYRELADRFPKHELADKALFACGVSLELAGRDSDAVAAWTGLLDGYPKSALVEESMYRKAMGELRLKRGGQAEETLRGAMKLFPGGKFAGEVAFWLGIRAMERGNGAPEAEAMFRRALEIKPEGELADEARFRLALALRELGREAEAGDILSGLLDRSGELRSNPGLLQWLAIELAGRGKRAESASVARVMLKTQTEPAWRQAGYALLGRALIADDKAGAAQAFEQAVAEKVETEYLPEAALRAGEFALQRGETAAAKGYLDRAAALSAGDELAGVRIRAYAGLGRAAIVEGRPEEAARLFMVVSVLYDDPALVPDCMLAAADAYRRMDRKDERMKVLRELVQRYPDSPAGRNAVAALGANGDGGAE